MYQRQGAEAHTHILASIKRFKVGNTRSPQFGGKVHFGLCLQPLQRKLAVAYPPMRCHFGEV